MSLLKWSTPERRSGDRILPIIPNEIYLQVLDHVARPSGPLAPEELETFTNLSGVCRFFANVCLPRIFEFVEFSGFIFRDDIPTALRNDAVHKTSRESALCTQIAAGQPLALALAKTVKACRFAHWTLEETGSWAVRLFAKKYIHGMSYMVNIRKLEFSNSFVNMAHWDAIATLGSLEELSFDECKFLGGPMDVEPDRRAKIKVPHLRVIDCDGNRQHIAAVDPRFLRHLTMDDAFFKQVDWLPQSALAELDFRASQATSRVIYAGRLHAVLVQAPKSLEAISLTVLSIPTITPSITQYIAGRIFDDLAWKNLPLLRSVTLQVPLLVFPGSLTRVISSALEGIRPITSLRSFTLQDYLGRLKLPPTEILPNLHDKLGAASNVKHVDICGSVFHLVNGEWSEVSS